MALEHPLVSGHERPMPRARERSASPTIGLLPAAAMPAAGDADDTDADADVDGLSPALQGSSTSNQRRAPPSRALVQERVLAFARTASQSQIVELLRKLSSATSIIADLEAANAQLVAANQNLVRHAMAASTHASALADKNVRLVAELQRKRKREPAVETPSIATLRTPSKRPRLLSARRRSGPRVVIPPATAAAAAAAPVSSPLGGVEPTTPFADLAAPAAMLVVDATSELSPRPARSC